MPPPFPNMQHRKCRPERDVVVILTLLGAVEAAIVICKFALAVWAVCLVESVTVIVTDAVPTELCAGTPEIPPVERLIDNPLGSPLALYLYGRVPPIQLSRRRSCSRPCHWVETPS
jgi:hypothetical protein